MGPWHPTPDDETGQRQALAYHVAGHVVVSRLLNREIARASILDRDARDEHQEHAGISRASEGPDHDPRIHRANMEHEALVLFAGEIGEFIGTHAQSNPWAAVDDRDSIVALVLLMNDNERDLAFLHHDYLKKRAWHLFDGKLPLLAAVAEALLEHDELDHADVLDVERRLVAGE